MNVNVDGETLATGGRVVGIFLSRSVINIS